MKSHVIKCACLAGLALGALPMPSVRAEETPSPIVPFIIPNGRPTEAEIRGLVRTLKANGYGQFMPYPSTGLDYEYLGEDFFRMMGWFIDEARRLGLKVWLYDEFNWPSGTARGRVPAENADCLYRELVAVTNAAGDVSWQMLVSREKNVDNDCLDTNNLEPASVTRFLELTHQAYAQRFGRDMGTVIKGFFTDEPGHCSSAWRLRRPPNRVLSLPYWRSMEDDYAAATGGRAFRADCLKELRAGTLATGEALRTWTAIRSTRYRQSYFDRIAAFCASNGIVSTGHLYGEQGPAECARVNGLPLRTLEGLTKPGIDLVFSNVGPDYEWITLALGQSAAWHRGRPGSAELFALGPCDLTFAMMRRQYWIAALFGIDTYFQALYHQRATRFEFKDSWAMFTSPAQPWFGESRLLHEEARKAAAWAKKPQACALAVVYPQRTAGACALAKRLAPDLAGLCRTLSWNGFNYLLVEEDEKTSLPHVLDWQGTNLVDRATGARLAGAEAILDWAERRLGRRRTPGRIVRDYLDGSRVTVDVAACSVTVETKGGQSDGAPAPASASRDVRPGADSGWRLKLDGPSRRRVWFWTSNVGPVVNRPWESGPKAKATNQRRDQPDNSAKVTLEVGLKGVRFVLRTAGKDRLSVTLDGKPLDFSEEATSLVYSFNEICRETKPMDLAAGEHVLVLSGGRDGKMFFPVLWMVGDFAERAPGRLSPLPASVGLGSLAAAGLGSFAGTATYSTEAAFARGERLVVDGGGAVVRVRYGGRDLGARGWAPFAWEIPPELAGRKLPLEIDVITSVRPIFGSDKSPDACLNHSLWVESTLADPSPVGLRRVTAEAADGTATIPSRETPDPRVRTYVDPVCVVWQTEARAHDDGWPVRARVENAARLLTTKFGQVCEGAFGKACGTRLVNGGNDAGLVLDFGRELHGGLQLGVSPGGTARAQFRVRFGESVAEAMSTVGEKGSSNDHALRDFVVTVPSFGTLEVGNTGFRFVRLDLVSGGEVGLEFVRAVSLMRPMRRLGGFRSSDERLNRIFETAVRTVHLCCQDYLWDGIKRDRLVWVGDMHPEMATILNVFGAAEILPQSLEYAIATTPPDRWMNTMAPYTLWFVRNLAAWCRYTGRPELLRRHEAYFRATLAHVAGAISPDGTWAASRFLDWPTQHNPQAVVAGMQGLLALACDDAADLLDCLGDGGEAAAWRGRAETARHVRADAHGSKAAAAMLALSGCLDPKAAFRDVLAKGGHRGVSTFYGYYMLEAMSAAGERQRALDTVRDYWGGMLDVGATSFWENFDLAWTNGCFRIDELPVPGKRDVHGDYGEFCYPGFRHSLCHGWSAGPAAWCIGRILGIRPVADGCRRVEVKPFLGDLAWAEGAMALPDGGAVKVRAARRSDGMLDIRVEAPDGVEVVR